MATQSMHYMYQADDRRPSDMGEPGKQGQLERPHPLLSFIAVCIQKYNIIPKQESVYRDAYYMKSGMTASFPQNYLSSSQKFHAHDITGLVTMTSQLVQDNLSPMLGLKSKILVGGMRV